MDVTCSYDCVERSVRLLTLKPTPSSRTALISLVARLVQKVHRFKLLSIQNSRGGGRGGRVGVI